MSLFYYLNMLNRWTGFLKIVRVKIKNGRKKFRGKKSQRKSYIFVKKKNMSLNRSRIILKLILRGLQLFHILIFSN